MPSLSTTTTTATRGGYTKLARRNTLIGLAVTTILPILTALAAPPVPDVANCHPTDGEGAGPSGMVCCPTAKMENIIDFDPARYPNPVMRIRRPAHQVGSDQPYMDKFREAIRRMQALPETDPRNFQQQARLHCAYCNGCYRQVGSPELDFLVHKSWLFLPFHRAYLYFIERILGKLMNDTSFALPFWNWDHPDGMRLPEIFTGGPSNPLFDECRDPKHQPPTLVDLNFGASANRTISDERQIHANLFHMKVSMVRNKGPGLFMGGPFLAGDDVPVSSGAFERVPHNLIHLWVGDPKLYYRKDMGNFFSAALDPVFYSHHANVDRLLSVWKTLDKKNHGYRDANWLNSSFVFFDENAQPVRIYVRDCLTTEQLGYTYSNVTLPWFHFSSPTPRKRDGSLERMMSMPAVALPRALDSVIRTRVARPDKGRRRKIDKEENAEVLVVELELVKFHDLVKFDVYVNDYEESEEVAAEYVGSFVEVPSVGKRGRKSRTGKVMKMKRVVRLALTDLIDELGVDDDEYVDVVLVPRVGKNDVVIKDVKIEFIAY